jgi:predicted RNase H-like nuclease (RuvC/YqgF family)
MQDNYNSEIERSIKVVETIGIQKKVLEDENEELRSRITDLEHERENMKAHVKKRIETNQTLTSPTSNGVPPLNLAKTNGERHYL